MNDHVPMVVGLCMLRHFKLAAKRYSELSDMDKMVVWKRLRYIDAFSGTNHVKYLESAIADLEKQNYMKNNYRGP